MAIAKIHTSAIGADVVILGEGLIAAGNAGTAHNFRMDKAISGKTYAELTKQRLACTTPSVLGVVNSAFDMTGTTSLGEDVAGDSVGIKANGDVRKAGATVVNIGAIGLHEWVSIAVNASGEIWVRVDGGAWLGSGSPDPETDTDAITSLTGTLYYAATIGNTSTTSADQVFINVGAVPFLSTEPSGYSGIDTFSQSILWNSADKDGDITLSNSDKTAWMAVGQTGLVRATHALPSTGKHYFEVYYKTCGGASSHIGGVGFSRDTVPVASSVIPSSSTVVDQYNFQNGLRWWHYPSGGPEVYTSGADPGNAPPSAGLVIGYAINMDTGEMWSRYISLIAVVKGDNGAWYYSGDPAAGTNSLQDNEASCDTVVNATDLYITAWPYNANPDDYATIITNPDHFFMTKPVGFSALEVATGDQTFIINSATVTVSAVQPTVHVDPSQRATVTVNLPPPRVNTIRASVIVTAKSDYYIRLESPGWRGTHSVKVRADYFKVLGWELVQQDPASVTVNYGTIKVASYTNAGSFSLPLLSVVGDLTVSPAGAGSLSLPLFTVEGNLSTSLNVGTIELPLFTVEGYTGYAGELTLPMLTVVGTAESVVKLDGSFNMLLVTVAGTTTHSVTCDGAFTLPLFTVQSNDLYTEQYVTGEFSLPLISISGTILVGIKLDGVFSLPIFTASGVLLVGVKCDGTFNMPLIELDGNLSEDDDEFDSAELAYTRCG